MGASLQPMLGLYMRRAGGDAGRVGGGGRRGSRRRTGIGGGGRVEGVARRRVSLNVGTDTAL